MTTLDTAIVILYLGLVFLFGWLAGRRQKRGDVGEFFLAGRSLPWWVVGTSMVATSLAADTPLAVAGMTISGGVAKNWFWWSFIVSHTLMAMVLARLWRRAGVITDAEFVSRRYSGPWVKPLRNIKAFISAVLPELSEWQVVGGLLFLTLIYSVRSGFHGVVWTDIVQFPLALFGTFYLAWVAVDQAGGLSAVSAAAVERSGPEAISLFPTSGELLPLEALFTFLAVQWWAQKGSDGGGIIIQRLSAARSERDAQLGGLWFCVAHYLLRPWPWILTGLAALVLVPDFAAADPEGAYAEMIVSVLPAGARGLLVAAFLAAFMSTIDTHLNWGASYVVNDLIGSDRGLSEERTRLISRLAVISMAGLALVATGLMGIIEGGWKIVIVMSAGGGAVFLLRWFWWRLTAEAEIAAVVSSILLTIAIYSYDSSMEYLHQMAIVVGGSAVAWITALRRSQREPADLVDFYRAVRPPGPGWAAVAKAAGMEAPEPLLPLIRGWLGALGGITLLLVGTGWALLSSLSTGLAAIALGVVLLALALRASLNSHGSVTIKQAGALAHSPE